MDARIKRRNIHFRDTLDSYGSKIPGNKIRFGHPRSKIRKIRFGEQIFLIWTNSRHTPSDINLKCTCLNDTPSGSLLVVKPASQESSLNYIQNYPIIYGSKVTWFQNPNNNLIGSQSIPLKFPILLRVAKLHWSRWCSMAQRNQYLEMERKRHL